MTGAEPGGTLAGMAPLVCQACGTPVGLDEPIPRDAECGGCRRDLRCCMNCRHYDPRYHNACRETMADPVEDKARRNFCEYFSFSREPGRGGGGSSSSKEAEARAKLSRMFGGGDARPSSSESARRKLESLFGPPKEPDEPAGDV